MKRSLLIPLTLLVAIVSAALTRHAFAQEWAGLRNNMIETTYVIPRNPANMPTYLIFRDQQVLEELSAFLSPLRLPAKLSIKMIECGNVNLYYAPGQGVIICYEFPRALWRFASEIGTPRGFTRRDVLVGSFVLSALHEVGHAVFDLLKVPIFGRQEDAADQIAAFVMLNFGEEFAQRNLDGAARFFRALDRPMSRTAYADEHGTWAQRFYNLLCIAYGGQPQTFKNVAATGTLPADRAANCGREYRQVEFAFSKTIWPHVDQRLFDKVKSTKWASWESNIEKTSHLTGTLVFFGFAVAWTAVIVFLVAKTSSSGKEVFRQMTILGLAAFRGRLDRIHWWAYTLTAGLIWILLSFALSLFQVDFASPQPLRVAHELFGWIILIMQCCWHASFASRRLHDRNMYGWLAAFWLAPWVISAMIGAFPELAGSSFLIVCYLLSFLLWFWMFVELGFLRGTQGQNSYGPETQYDVLPKAAPSVSASQM